MNVITPTTRSAALDTTHLDVPFPFKTRYGNFINGEFVAPKSGQYFENPTPITGEILCECARSNADDVDAALDAAHAAFPAWGKSSITERSNILLKIADVMEANTNLLAVAESMDNGKPIRESIAADLALAVDHFRYFAGVIRAEEGTIGEIDSNTYAYHINEPLGVVGQIIPWNFPLLMATWKVAPALAAGNCVVLKPAEQTPASIMVLMELIGDLLPPGVLNVVNGFGLEAGKPLASSKRIAKIAFTGETTTGRLIMQYASQNIIPVTLELGGKSPNIFFADVMTEDDAFFDKCLEGFAMFALNQGEVCTCPSRVLVQESIADAFIEKAVARTKAVTQGNPLSMETMIGAQASVNRWKKSRLIWNWANRKAPKFSQVVTSPPWVMVLKTATIFSRLFSKATTKCVSSRKRSLALWFPSPPSRMRQKRWKSQMTPFMALELASGPVMDPKPSVWVATSKPVVCGPTVTTPTQPMLPLVATSNLASVARPTK